jgi:hypothetical protein
VPTVAESGLAEYESVSVGRRHGARRAAAPIVSKLNGEFVRILRLPDVRSAWRRSVLISLQARPANSPLIYSPKFRKWTRVAKAAHVQLD